jgi:hypothetical protein
MSALKISRMALSRPCPGPFTKTLASRIKKSRDLLAAVSAAFFAANPVDLRFPLKPQAPDELQHKTSPLMLVIVTIVL